ncbi:MAG: hypothetical protein ACRD2P_16810 [Terriglobia bacterium]
MGSFTVTSIDPQFQYPPHQGNLLNALNSVTTLILSESRDAAHTLKVDVKPPVEVRTLARNLQKSMLFSGCKRRKIIDVVGGARKTASPPE